jgi:putative toxin-antitoxin system antitoxin component (TIGR02293 family)
MGAKKGTTLSDQPAEKKKTGYVHTEQESSAAANTLAERPAGPRSSFEISLEPATRRAMQVLKSYYPSFRSPAAKLAAIKKGLEAHAISDLLEITGATQTDLANILDLTEPTLRKHIKAGKKLNIGLSEHILQLFQLFDKGMDTFGSLAEFKGWLSHESIALMARPIAVLDTITGINMVMDELIRIDYGIMV